LLHVGVALALSIGLAGVFVVAPRSAVATGQTDCSATDHHPQAGESAISSNYVVGARATIEGQALPLCTLTFSYASGAMHWVGIGNVNPAWFIFGFNIVQLGYGRCYNTNNGDPNLGTLCNSNYYYYWAWGTEGCGPFNGTDGFGPKPIRIGAPLSSPPSSADFYVLRHTVGGTIYYDGYVNGSLLTGPNALGQTVSARVPASSLCWDSNQTYRKLLWFGETFNNGDSMGGWTGNSRNHLDYNPLKYSWGTGWQATSLVAPNPCNILADAPTFTCTIAGSDHTYVDTNR
jgi:hypothetical protein